MWKARESVDLIRDLKPARVIVHGMMAEAANTLRGRLPALLGYWRELENGLTGAIEADPLPNELPLS